MFARKRRLLFQVIVASFFVVANVAPSFAAPADPLTGAAQSFDTAPPEATNYNVGDWGVADERGAATYTFPIEVPPGRNGMAPKLALRYSSQSPLRGGIAAGWTFDLPTIEADYALGYDGGLPTYKASLPSASGRLIKVNDKLPYDDAVAAYRVNFDTSYIRFFRRESAIEQRVSWTALTTDGVKHHFTDQNGGTSDPRWLIKQQVDPFGNTIDYFWSSVFAPDGTSIDYRLDRIEYSSNANAGLTPHAKVKFDYGPLKFCVGAQMPIGAAARLGSYHVNGSSAPATIRISVRDQQGGVWRLSREITVSYELHNSTLYDNPMENTPPQPVESNLLDCKQNLLRYLSQIDVAAYSPEGTITRLPPLTFRYNRRINTTPPPAKSGCW